MTNMHTIERVVVTMTAHIYYASPCSHTEIERKVKKTNIIL